MDNYDAVAYACVSLREIKEESTEVTEENLRKRMFDLMDKYSELEILRCFSKDKYFKR